MTWWLRIHAVPSCAAAVVLCFVLAPLLSSSALPVPSLFGGLSSTVPVPLVLPVLPACALLYGLNRAPSETEATAAGPMTRWSVGLLTGACTAAALLAVAETLWMDFPLALAVARNTAGYLGFGLVAQRVAGRRYGPAAAALLPVACAFIGLGPGGRPYPWTWPLHPSQSASAAAAAFSLALIGAALLRNRSRGRPGPLPRQGPSPPLP
ncbi:hypothetical protein ACFSJS_16420 [Streptomyces desertarenae]|uniref:Integral membrane protein n=1 Tax=Streptomyces desertarenae TaxID=2666184 RepID=A0ABW4PLT2_9ACTN